MPAERIRYHQMLVSPHVGGGARIAMAIHQHLVHERGPVGQFLVPPGGEAERMVRAAGAPFVGYDVERLTGTGRIGSLLENLGLCGRMARFRAGILHVHAPFVFGAIRPFRSVSSLRCVLHVRLDFAASDLASAVRRPPDAIVVCAEYMRGAVEEALTKSGASGTLVRVVRNAVDTDAFSPGDRHAAKLAVGADPGSPLAMVIANLSPHKGQHTAIQAVARLKDRGVYMRLWIVGAERKDAKGYLGRLQALCCDQGVADRVQFLGFRTDVAALLQAADYLLLPSTSEGLPLTILEAQASGAVAIAAPTAGVPEVVQDGTTGYVVAADDPEGYAQRLEMLQASDELTGSIRSAARQSVVERHGLDHYCQQIAKLYDEILLP